MDTTTILMLAVAAACALGTVVKFAALCANPADRSLRALCLLLAGLTVSVGIQPLVPVIDRYTGVPMLGAFIGNCAVLLAAGAGLAFLARVYHPPERADRLSRRRYAVLAGTLCAMAALFVLGPADPELAPPGTGHLALIPWPYLDLYLYSAFLGYTLVAVLRLGIRYAALTQQRALRLSLRVLTAAAAAGLVYTITSLVSLTLFEAGVDVDSWESATITPMYLATDVLMLAGCTIPAVAPRLSAAARRISEFRALRQLHPLWAALRVVHPDIALFPDPAPSWRTGTDAVRMRLYRKVIEIRDGQLALRPYLDAELVRTTAARGTDAGLPSYRANAAAEAVGIAAAIEAKAAGHAPRKGGDTATFFGGGDDLAAEVQWLQRVSREFVRVAGVSKARRPVPERGSYLVTDIPATGANGHRP